MENIALINYKEKLDQVIGKEGVKVSVGMDLTDLIIISVSLVVGFVILGLIIRSAIK